jgi:hypothetical protein
MTSIGVYLDDGTSYHFIQDNYHISFEGLMVMFHLKKECAHQHRPDKMILNYATKEFYRHWADGCEDVEMFKGVI